jgi:hypothetical protein
LPPIAFRNRSVAGDRRFHPLGAAQQAAQARQQDRKLEGLGQIIVRPRLETLQHIFRTAASGEHQHRHENVLPAKFADHPEAILAGKHDVEDHDIEAVGLPHHQIDGVLAVFNHGNLVTFGFKVETQPTRKMHFVFDNQDPAHATNLGRRMVMVAPFPSPSL